MVAYFLELRRRLLNVLCLFAALSVVCLWLAEPLFNALIYPLQAQLSHGQTLIATQLTSAVLTPLSIALHSACLLSCPYVCWQIWQFVHPALYGHEKGLFKWPLVAGFVLVGLGMAFAYFIALPLMFSFMLAYVPGQVSVMPDMASSVDLITRMLLLFGVCFQLPLLCFVLVRFKIMPLAQLKRLRPYVIVGAFTLGMLLTPPDVISQALLALPLWGLFELGLLACAWGSTD